MKREERKQLFHEPGFHPWLWLEVQVRGLIELERLYWQTAHAIRHPLWTYQDWSKWHHRPKVGDWVEDCRHQVHRVTDIQGDDLTLDDDTSVSWMHCCDWPRDTIWSAEGIN